ncbi:uncharacterized protein N7515_009388 [Penicillium bovifimosum]|uniref:SRR1-like domain-containing protein n=1 Tax=Penicillium bovifimosum TaxID=126998 RepID=A0A9W9GJ76_9EURO|nr:uncharacterized protein N7515_009388 [Penicillium bovifimosum]KAJ5121427.1 hypothetical protein N7515_009388 [Penicillium bovifimosum]
MSSDIEVVSNSTSQQSYTTSAITFPTLLEPRSPPTNDEAKARIQELYDSGVPFFTKDAIREIWEQMQRQLGQGDKVVVKDVTGAKLGCEVKLGKTDHELALSYRCASQLKREIDYDWDEQVLDSVYAPILVSHHLCELDSTSETKEIIPNTPIGEKGAVALDFQEKRKKWEESSTCKKFFETLASSAGSHEIKKIIGFACGSLSLPNNSHSATEHALLVSVRDWLKSRDGDKEAACYVQDPMNTSVDREVLAEVGFEVIDDPRGWLEVDEKSFVISIAPNVPVKEIIADIARPAVVIWFRVKAESNDEGGDTDPDSSRVRAMMEEYELFELEPYDDLAENVVVYIRKSGSATK